MKTPMPGSYTSQKSPVLMVLKSVKKYKNHRQAGYDHTLKGTKTLSSAAPETRTWDLLLMKRGCYQLSYPSE